MQLDVRHLQLIRAIADEASVTRAGNRLHLSQPALSRQLRDAEERLGLDLFYRQKRKMVLTPAGEELLASARTILEQLERVENRLRGVAVGSEGVLRIASECHTCYRWLPAKFAAFRARHPRVDLRVIASATPNPFEALLDGTIDLAIASSTVTDGRFVTTPLFRDELVVVVSPEHPAARRRRFHPRDFEGEHLFVYNLPLDRNRIAREVLIPNSVTPASVTQIQLTEGIVEMVKAGLGIAVLARWAVARELDAGDVIGIPLAPQRMRRRWSAVRRKADATPQYVADFIQLAAKIRT
jgi:LysR family transcriptional regulator for metE and metH